MTVKDLLDKVKGLPPDTTLCIAELDERFASNIAEIEVIDNASVQSQQANGAEVIDLEGGKERAVIIRW
jgi:hypothetical protein